MSVLMSAEHPNRFTLEDLCQALESDMLTENAKLAAWDDPSAGEVLDNNNKILRLLREIKTLQEKSIKTLAENRTTEDLAADYKRPVVVGRQALEIILLHLTDMSRIPALDGVLIEDRVREELAELYSTNI